MCIILQLFPPVQDFDVQHDYIVSRDDNVQSRIRKRGQGGIAIDLQYL